MIFLGVSLKDILAFIGGAVVFLTFLKLLFDVIPKLDSIKTSFFRFLTGYIKHKSLEKRAIANDIEEVVNKTVLSLKNELPTGWVNKVKIDWIKEENIRDIDDGELILRLRPYEDQDQNLMNGIYCFFNKALFPENKSVLPEIPRKASVLQLSRRTINIHHPFAMSKFERQYLDSAIEIDEDYATYLGYYSKMDKRGYFTGVYIREISKIADNIRYSPLRKEFSQEIDEIIGHINFFIDEYPNTPDELWYRVSEITRYGFILVARPVPWRRVETYVNKAHYHSSNGIERLYILGAHQEKSFVKKVITAIVQQTDYSITEEFELNKDYRGESGGICAIFDVSSTTKIVNKTEEV